ncbi:MAG: hypothetical protein MUO82_10390 [Candidatus Thermoplasmatota archaeon]|nr:hypothetical protein [Candidatus Thermoplasmatota archaeon]
MAKRRKENEEEQEDKAFKVPKFDEESFLKRERRNIKTSFLSFLFACLMALVCFGFWALMGSGTGLRWFLVFLVCIANAAFIKFIFLRLNIDISDFTKKNWFMIYGVYFFTWLLVLIVLVNPPFYDDEAPMVDLVVLPDIQEFGNPVKIVARITDNAGVDKSGIIFTINNQTVDNNDFDFTDDIFSYEFSGPTNDSTDITYNFEIKVNDLSGIQALKSSSFKYSKNTIKLVSHDTAYTSPGPVVYSATPINFEVKANADIIYYTVNDGPRINVSKKDDYFTTYPKFKGWLTNQNVTVKVYAETIHYFKFVMPTIPTKDFNLTKYNNTIVDSQIYYFRTGTENIGLDEPPKSEGPIPEYIQVPGFETIILITALFVVILIFKKKNKDEKKQK